MTNDARVRSRATSTNIAALAAEGYGAFAARCEGCAVPPRFVRVCSGVSGLFSDHGTKFRRQ